METSNTLIPVPFRNTTLFLVDIDGVPYTPMKPIVEGMGISWQGQHEKLNENKGRWGVKIILIPTSGGQQEMFCLPLRKLPGWLMTIHSNKVKADIRETVIAYQNECDDALWDYWTQGQAINPRNTTSDHAFISRELAIAIYIAEAAARMLRMSDTSKIRMLTKIAQSEHISPAFLPDYVDEPLVRAITPLLKEMRSPLFHHVAKTVNPALEAMGILEHLSRKSTGNTIKKFWSLTEEGLKYGRNETSPNNPRETQPLFFVERFPELLARLDAYINPQSLPL
ncbi:phage antirepressor N-terminal domain-containing protein [Chromatium okenii]|uniref:phage antirepressor N-terminal domain-containing protein n=1 Tax=Chromatium okenii TaxID=61644 RepID=UPI0026F11FB5|nr:phage antirepressor N-terminal domain-containing protein [Chromatium okenii]MBV5308675.1 phage antirepressor N-terminal domain-containing protein [Chromatium okenii]